MRILLIGPYKGSDDSGDSFLAPPFGLYRIKFYVESKVNNAFVRILDPNIEDYNKVDGEYDLIGFSVLHLTLQHDIKLFYFFKKKYPDSIFLAGGIEVSFIAEKVLEYAPFDIIILGEGEKTLVNILQVIEKGEKRFDGIKSIYWQNDGKVQFNGYGEQLDLEDFKEIYSNINLSKIPYDLYWENNARLYQHPNPREIRTVRSIFSNHCPFNCKFCSSTNFLSFSYSGKITGKCMLYMLPVGYVIQYIKRIVDSWKEVETIIFDDDNLSLNSKYLKELCQEIIKSKRSGELKANVNFICQGRTDFFSDRKKEILNMMNTAGFRMIMYGVESFSDNALQYMGKRSTNTQAKKTIECTLNAGVRPLIYIILFPPNIVKEDLIVTIDECVEQFSNGVEISTTLLLMDIPGSAFSYDVSLRRMKRRYYVNTDAFMEKSDYIWPNDDEMYELSRDLIKNYKEYESAFKKKYRINHIPGRVYSIIIFDVIYKKLCMEGKRKHLHRIFSDMAATFQ